MGNKIQRKVVFSTINTFAVCGKLCLLNKPLSKINGRIELEMEMETETVTETENRSRIIFSMVKHIFENIGEKKNKSPILIGVKEFSF